MSSTPQRSPAKRGPGITQREKQALVDDLQLEITERARKLRAQYALQAQGLRTRLEMRVNRIPQALRKRNIQDLVDEHTAKANPLPPPPMPVAAKVQVAKAATKAPAPSKQPSKRKSDDISTGDDKENLPAPATEDLANPKKRTKLGAVVANSKATRTASRKAGPAPAGVLSPKSHNSRTYPQSPLKPSTLSSAQSAAPPTKASTRAPSRQTGKRTVATAEADGRTSGASDSSAGTTIVTKPGTRKAPLPKRAAKPATASRKPALAKQDTAPPPAAAAGRTLRKRN
ncbi:hypothetical protein CLAFUW4_00983 [Fulvia fulva]|uniref:Borealin N-terminal domain-containing protein n=1 Tax=Passalora fulva TaxID=5499 RepID=A0A9Q8L4T9_PASFU|nr:uncharacterized protein CLAFUR5_00989 [Fulvia fulva]KAK4635013.1 hypothetical protein CLAFUR4_00984 [Fulvia fulva]KAK4636508.1 hypothetical protein CLAFUR0_00985 [Fulvia fulva]UJO10812.1 hypothetical protein CLAFUR5_00989 [Fulvia fulva]WPV09452.1 hypothetical protein CLAFUW4_00983 [Fulvia fulva]WPV24030.1 hypothetical protein CLAFUW7_00833 [Fulvia fulva]